MPPFPRPARSSSRHYTRTYGHLLSVAGHPHPHLAKALRELVGDPSTSSWEALRNQSLPLSIFESVAIPFNVDRSAMVQDPIQNSCGDNMILEDVSSFTIGLVRCEYDRSLLVPPGDQLEETVCTQLVKRQISYLIYDQELKLR